MTSTSTPVGDAKQDRRRERETRRLDPASASARGDRLPPPPRERRPALAALAVLLIVGGAAVAGLLAVRADERVPVLVAVRDIAAGEQITADALGTSAVAAEGTLLISAADAELVVGRHAAVSIRSGQLLDSAMVTDAGLLQPGRVAVGAALAVGRFPASGLQPGDRVQLVSVAEPGGAAVVEAVVSSAFEAGGGTAGGGGGLVATFIVPEGVGPQVATVAASGDLSVVLLTRGGAGGN